MKRVLDIMLSLLLLVFLSPVFLAVVVMIALKMGRPIFFTQERPGLNGVPFKLFKFRTMMDLYDQNGDFFSDEMRLTNIGRMIRKYSLDELPQLINVLRGEMSLVGPRPLLMEYLVLYSDEQLVRHDVKPGITGWAQINGRNSITWEEKFKMDSWYVKNQSFLLDCKILLKTLKKVLKKEGITQRNHASSEKFTGSKEVI
ncbi:sugar transferase [Jeotgalibacillus marinus]|uniref:Sugar transferase n=1 Tax=Jeotgalibacillus marinus TaxID=86667 RepID=A0ABV3Q168_9BACL